MKENEVEEEGCLNSYFGNVFIGRELREEKRVGEGSRSYSKKVYKLHTRMLRTL